MYVKKITKFYDVSVKPHVQNNRTPGRGRHDATGRNQNVLCAEKLISEYLTYIL